LLTQRLHTRPFPVDLVVVEIIANLDYQILEWNLKMPLILIEEDDDFRVLGLREFA